MRPSAFRILQIGVTAAALCSLAVAHKKPPPPFYCRVTVQVVNSKGEPVRNAGVVLTQVSDLQGKRVKDPLHVELKSDEKGAATMAGFLPGIILVQVIADGYRTMGNYYKLQRPNDLIAVRLQSPGGQVSVYKGA